LADLEAVYDAAEAAEDSDLEIDSAATEAADEAEEAEELGMSAEDLRSEGSGLLCADGGDRGGRGGTVTS
jgi:hypothetical protein